jgi:hypothetical protein
MKTEEQEKNMKTKWMMVVLAVIAIASTAFAAPNTATGTTPIVAIKAESLSISASGLTPFDLGSLTSQTLTINSSWNLVPARASVAICAYMDTTTGVMKGTGTNTDVIDQTMVQAKVGAGSFANINAAAGCGLPAVTSVKSYALSTQADRKNVTKTDTLGIQLNGVPAALQADTYTGAITVVAYAQ